VVVVVVVLVGAVQRVQIVQAAAAVVEQPICGGCLQPPSLALQKPLLLLLVALLEQR
jgi:hypothetical protein